MEIPKKDYSLFDFVNDMIDLFAKLHPHVGK